uniref:DNA-directed RNA polymerase M/15kDa subunit domain-containing protein n=1 Tax=viral metagenome TaxID=1070528 RepID=A0A6C0EXL4_9ZZZZ
MNFCPDCETYLVTKISSADNANKILSYVCNNCSYTKVVDITKEPEYKCVYKSNYNLKKIKIDQKNIQFLSKDPTLPHVNNIPCPNVECITNKENPNSEILIDDKAEKQNINDVLYIKLNESDLTFLYQCCNCNHTWTNK